MTTSSSQAHEICRMNALEDLNTNAIQDGQTPPAHGHWLEEDTAWGTPVSEIITAWLEDGTVSHVCGAGE